MPLFSVLPWLVLTAALFVGFTVQGAMWSAAQQENRNGWVIALISSLATAIVLHGINTAYGIWLACPP